MTDPQTDLDINASAQLSILEACRRVNRNVRLVFASTRQLYGRPDYLPVDEKHPIRPVDVNGINKLAGEGYHLLYSQVHGIRSSVLRLTNTYGPGMRVKDARQTFLGIWVRQLIEGSTIKVFGDGMQLRDFNYVDDCVEALLQRGHRRRRDRQGLQPGQQRGGIAQGTGAARDPTACRAVASRSCLSRRSARRSTSATTTVTSR